jgi:hypothetical protein
MYKTVYLCFFHFEGYMVRIIIVTFYSVHSRKLQKGAGGPFDSKTGGHFQKLGVDKGPRASKLEGNF